MWWTAAAIALGLAASLDEASAAVSIRGIHSSAGEEYTRIVIDLSATTRYQYGFVPASAGKPARVYVDVHDVVLANQKGEVIPVEDGRVLRVRTGQYQPKIARIVLEVDGVVTPKVLSVEDPPRIVVDLAGKARARVEPPKPPAPPTANAAPARIESSSPLKAPSLRPDGAAQAKPATSSPQASANAKATAPRQETTVARGPSGPIELPVTPGRGTAIVPTGPSRTQPPGSTTVAARSVTQGQRPDAPAASVTPTPPLSAGRGTAMRALPPKPAAPAMVAGASGPARPIRIVIDPGHGGKDPGAKGPGGTEKAAVLDIARRLAAKLRGELKVDVHLTRGDDRYVPLDQRKDLANRLEADMFVSIHANASRNSKLYGIETYYLKNTNDRATLRLARLENGVEMLIKGSDVSSDADLNYILSDIIQGQKEADSVLLANHIQAQLVGHLEKNYSAIRSLGVKQGPFLVLDGTYMPAVLVEAGFVTNAGEGRRLRAAAYQESVAEGIFRGIKAYLEDARVNDLI